MNNERIYQVLKGPVFSEKAQVLGDTAGVQVFKVDINATKLEIKKAVEKLLVQKLLKLTQLLLKVRLSALVVHQDVVLMLKAYVTLKAGQDVEMADLGDTAESAAE